MGIFWRARRKDQAWEKDPEKAKYTTQCTQMGQYLEIHGGPEHEVHVKYAEVMNVVFVTLMYGPGLPVLYVIAVAHYFIYYSVATWSLCYDISLPPSMDIQMARSSIRLLKWAPLLLLANAYWTLSNKQIFEGWVFPRQLSTEAMRSGHTLLTTLTLN